MEPVLNDIQKKYSNRLVILKVDGNKDFDLMKQFNVTALPVLIIFKNGKQVWRRDGVATEEEMTEQLNAK
jgi:thioredoxin-like negative regulator of GroEL